jgi:hypothetical protein
MKNGWGGARAGAGRPKGSKNRNTLRAIAALEASRDGEDISPLERMLTRMRELWREGDKKGATEVAAMCAPYIHSKAAQLQRQIILEFDPRKMSDQELEAAIAWFDEHKLLESPD